MTQIDLIDGHLIQVLPLHFNIAEHYLPLDEFIETAKNTRAIVENFNKEFCGGKLKYRIVVLPPEKGSFKSRLGVWIIAGASTLWLFAESDIGKGYISGLTGQEPAYWAKQSGVATKKAIDEVTKKDTNESKQAASVVLKECAKGFLAKDTDELRKIGMDKRHFREAYEAKNEFYTTCSNNPEIKGIGFDDTEKFPIKRVDFPRFIVDLPPKDDDDANLNWQTEVKTVTVTSPVWIRDGRLWQAKVDNKRPVLFSIDDDGFWSRVENNGLKPKIFDQLKVQWAFIADGKIRKNTRVLRVLEYNGSELTKPLSTSELNKVLKTFTAREDEDTPDLFNRKS
ncbi:MAG: hypothetical protein K8R48_08410 [Alphaproteobacteria bacterium]|nr:hypothetical protein [Alphaproteobacteria bacterium]